MKIRFKRVFRWDGDNKIFRVFRCGWNKKRIGHAHYLQAKMSFAITPHLFFFKRGCCNEVRLTLFGVSMHYVEYHSNGTLA